MLTVYAIAGVIGGFAVFGIIGVIVGTVRGIRKGLSN
jgi:hypothetical protein